MTSALSIARSLIVGMPWKEADVMTGRARSCWNGSAAGTEESVASSAGAVAERSTRPSTMPTRVSDESEDLVVAAHEAKPTYGPERLRARIVERQSEHPVPSPSTIGISKQPALSRCRCRRKRVQPTVPMSTKPFARVVDSNPDVCVDFDGQFRTQDGRWCYPLTVLDAHTALSRSAVRHCSSRREILSGTSSTRLCRSSGCRRRSAATTARMRRPALAAARRLLGRLLP